MPLVGLSLAALLTLASRPCLHAEGPQYAVRSSLRTTIFGAQRLPDRSLDAGRVPGRVDVITAGEIRASGARTLQELLASRLGVASFDDIGNSYQATVDLRGSNASPAPGVAVYVDGARVNEANFGQVNWQLLPLENIERLEVHPGPSTLYGRNAMSGVIHVTTRRAAKDQAPAIAGEAGASHGTHQRRKAWGRAGGSAYGLDYHVFLSKEQDYGWRRHSDADLGQASLKLGYRREDSDASVAFTRSDDRLQQPGSLTEAEAGVDPLRNVSEVDTVSRMNFLTYNHRQALPLDLSLAWNAHYRERREDTPLNRGRTSLTRSLADMRARGAAAQLSWDRDLGERRSVATAGLEAGDSEADSASVGSFGAFPFTSGNLARERSLGLFLQESLDLLPEALVLTAGLRYDRARVDFSDKIKPANDGSQTFHRTSPRVGLNANHASGARAYVLYAESFRAPTVNEVTSLGPFSQNVLRPVSAKSWELGGSAPLSEAAELKAAWFLADHEDDIFPVFDATQGFGRNINVERTRRTGVEWSLETRQRAWSSFLRHTYARSTFETDFTLDKVPFGATQAVRKGDRLPMAPEHRIAAGGSYSPSRAPLVGRAAAGLTLAADGLCVGGERLFGDEANIEPELAGSCVFNLGASYERSGWRAFLKGFNVFDRDYPSRGILATLGGKATRFVVPGRGFELSAGVSWAFAAGSAPAAEARAASERGAKRPAPQLGTLGADGGR